MKKILLLSVALALSCLTASVYAGDFIGSEKCSACHMDKYNDWKTSGHPYKLRPASIAKHAPLPLPEGYTWDDISYVIGGHRWKARFVDKNGYIITTDKQGKPMPTQWNIRSGKWVDYHPGEKKKYTCGPCHTSGYSKEGNQDGLEGIAGTWQAPGIHCEECHSAGGGHIAKGEKKRIIVDKMSALCGKCHIRGESEKTPAKKGFIRHHEQYNEYLASPHRNKLQCVTCHDPHKPARTGIRIGCGQCHPEQNSDFDGSTMQRAGVDCTDCHMPRASKSAEAMSPTEGDVRTHNWKISTDPNESMFTADGKHAKGFVTLDFVCLQCHGNRTLVWAAKNIKKIHGIGK
jgi:hypothetical protein